MHVKAVALGRHFWDGMLYPKDQGTVWNKLTLAGGILQGVYWVAFPSHCMSAQNWIQFVFKKMNEASVQQWCLREIAGILSSIFLFVLGFASTTLPWSYPEQNSICRSLSVFTVSMVIWSDCDSCHMQKALDCCVFLHFWPHLMPHVSSQSYLQPWLLSSEVAAAVCLHQQARVIGVLISTNPVISAEKYQSLTRSQEIIKPSFSGGAHKIVQLRFGCRWSSELLTKSPSKRIVPNPKFTSQT